MRDWSVRPAFWDALPRECIFLTHNMVTKSDLSDIMKLFESGIRSKEVLILDSEPFIADIAYQKIYKRAKKNIIVVDDYIGVKTLYHLIQAGNNADTVRGMRDDRIRRTL